MVLILLFLTFVCCFLELGDDCEGDVEVTTEVPTPHQVFGKMRERSKASSDASDMISSNTKLLKPTFTKRKASSSHPQGEGKFGY